MKESKRWKQKKTRGYTGIKLQAIAHVSAQLIDGATFDSEHI